MKYRGKFKRLCELLFPAPYRLDKGIPIKVPMPTIVCLCGSTRFMDAFHKANKEESLKGHIVLTVEVVAYDGATDPQQANPEQKLALDALHFRKIDLCDEVLVLNVGGYIGYSTRREIDYTGALGKKVRWLEHDIPAWKKVLNKARRKGNG